LQQRRVGRQLAEPGPDAEALAVPA
jgi:hypothetical protein